MKYLSQIENLLELSFLGAKIPTEKSKKLLLNLRLMTVKEFKCNECDKELY